MALRAKLNLILAGLLLLGFACSTYSYIWLPALEAASIDVILTPEELRSRDNIDIVHRAMRHRTTMDRTNGWIGTGIGLLIVAGAATGLVLLQRLRDAPDRPL